MKYVAVLLALFVSACEARVDTPTPEDLRLLLRPEAMKSNTKPVDAKAVVCAVQTPYDSYRRVSCVYNSSKSAYANDNTAILYFDSQLNRYYSAMDAETGYRIARDGWFEGLKKFHWQQADELLDLGDQHYAAYLMDGDTPRGNAFLVRKGTILVSLLVTGNVFHDRAEVHAMLEPIVAEAAKQD